MHHALQVGFCLVFIELESIPHALNADFFVCIQPVAFQKLQKIAK
jgi:hypothetical protein